MVNDTKATLSLAAVSKALLDSLSVGWDTPQPPLTVVGVTVQQPLLLWLREALAHGEDVLRGRIATLERELVAARDVVAQARNVSPRICGAAGVLDETVKAYDAVVNKGQE